MIKNAYWDNLRDLRIMELDMEKQMKICEAQYQEKRLRDVIAQTLSPSENIEDTSQTSIKAKKSKKI